MNGWLGRAPEGWEQTALSALEEDLGHGDLSASALPEGAQARWTIEAQAEGVLCGAGAARWILGDGAAVLVQDGSDVGPGTRVLEGRSDAAWALSRERTALNFLMILSGTATLTRRFVRAVEGLQVRIVDTRKSLPGLRRLQKYAVRCGGGHSHRMGLFDAVMIKDNHIALAGSVGEALRRARAASSHMTRIEVECESLDQAQEAHAAGADVLLLDNMSPAQLSECRRALPDALLEASGGVNLETVRAIAETGVDIISVGALTHSAPALALHMEIE
jgi:nicotinate-nucleotide pyrophosphorylase (carboxylating)